MLPTNYALHFIGVPYRWAGKEPIGGFDCSGLVCEALRACGIIPFTNHFADLNSQAIFNYLRDQKYPVSPLITDVKNNSVIFFGQNLNSIVHVALGLNSSQMIEAAHGGSRTQSIERASEVRAFVKVSQVSRRSDFLATIDLNLN